MVNRRKTTLLPRYEEIAMDIATRIVSREYRRGDKLFGRSSLAGRYKVSPETIRRAVALLHSRGVVASMPGSGVVVISEEEARRYLDEAQVRTALQALEEEIESLLEKRRDLDEKLESAIGRVIHYTSGTITTMRHVEEVSIPNDSSLVGQTLASADLRTRTGATVVGMARGREEIFSPRPDMEIRGGDVLIIVGADEAKELLKNMAEDKRAESLTRGRED